MVKPVVEILRCAHLNRSLSAEPKISQFVLESYFPHPDRRANKQQFPQHQEIPKRLRHDLYGTRKSGSVPVAGNKTAGI